MLDFDEPAMKSLLVDIDEHAQAKASADINGWLRDLLERIRSRHDDRRMSATVQSLKRKTHEPHDELELLSQLIAQERTRQGISSPTEG
jgi:hypothetical protein